ncbi:MAG: hypothetical protein BMS9Abin29_2105 [Gemmatimonadota bacterium]|nr:MAG: hypothetical protein BMS9Abin29_2105 [Gemmatimonadota bacterium]
MEWIQGRLWQVTVMAMLGSLVTVLPLIWSLAMSQDFWSLGPLEEHWKLGITITLVGLAVLFAAFFLLFSLMRAAGRAADLGYGFLTIAEVTTDLSRDTGFLLQGKRLYSRFRRDQRGHLVMARLTGAILLLVSSLWLAVGFAVAVALAARGVIGPRDVWFFTAGPSVVFFVTGGGLYLAQAIRVRMARASWLSEDGVAGWSVREDATRWSNGLDEARSMVALDAGKKHQGKLFRNAAVLTVLLFVIIAVPIVTISITGAVGPLLAEIAIPQFLSVQEMAGAIEPLRRYRLEADPSISPVQAGLAFNNLAFVGLVPEEGRLELAPTRPYPEHWFPNPGSFPNIFQEDVARDLMIRTDGGFDSDELAALRQAAAHPGQRELEILARAGEADLVSTRWQVPFPDTLSMFTMPLPHFTEIRYAALANVSRAAVEVIDGDPAQAEETLYQLISAGFLLVDQGPTLIDNLMGVVIVGLGGDALEGLYEVRGRTEALSTLKWARESAAAAAHASRLGVNEDDIHTVLKSIPSIVEDGSALRGLRWEYLATFNMLAPCINLHKMVFGPDETYDEWLLRSEAALVRFPGEAPLFELASSGVTNLVQEVGTLSRILTIVLGSQTKPGSCAMFISAFETRGGL